MIARGRPPDTAPIPHAIERIIERCLAKDPADRYANGREILLALEMIDASVPSLSNLESLPASHAAPAMHRARARRHAVLRRAAMVLGAAAIVVAGGGAFIAGRGRLTPPSHAAASSSAPPSSAGAGDAASVLAAARQKDRDGRHDLACVGYERASEIDPTAAEPAFEAAARCHRGDPAVGRVFFRRAWAGRAQLSPVQAARLNAFEPVFQREPHDLPETLARFEEVVRRFPDSADARWELGLYLLNAEEGGGVTRRGFTEIARALAADPVHAEWLLLDADRRAYAGDFAGARDDLKKCVRVAPEALECLEELAWIEGEQGACDQVEVAERRIQAIDPTFAGSGGQGLANAMYAQGATAAAVETLLRRGREAFPAGQRALLETRDQMHLDVLTGDLTAAERLARALDDAARESPLASDHGDAAQVLVRIQAEAGLVEEASRTAARYLDGRDGWEPDAFFDDWAMSKEPTPLMLATRARAGALSASAFEHGRERTMERWKARVEPYVRPFVWAHGYAAPAETPAEARAAVQRVASPADVPGYTPLTLVDADIGRTFLLAGRIEDAVTHLERATHSCFALAHPVEHTRAHYFLGQAREARKDTAGACAAYRVVRDRWGAARPRSVTAEKALARMKALGCRE